jgi:type I restriction enzyme M protein
MAEHTRNLHARLWDIANTLRGKMDTDDFKDYILGFVFYKYLSERMEAYADAILVPDRLTFEEVEANPNAEKYFEKIRRSSLTALGFFLRPAQLFRVLTKRGNAGGANAFILDDLQHVLNEFEQSTQGIEGEDDFGNLFEDLDLTSSKLGKTEADKNKLIVRVMAHLNQIDFKIEDPESDMLGDAYEYLSGKFASGAGKKAGEFHTPQEVVTILAQIVTTGRDRLRNVYDPTCGSGSLLLRVAKDVKEVEAFCGQEMNPMMYNLSRMNG